MLSWGRPGTCACRGLCFCSLCLGLDLSLRVNCAMSVLSVVADKRKLDLLIFVTRLFSFYTSADGGSFADGGRFGNFETLV